MSEALDGGDPALHETALVGGDVNVGDQVVVRVGDTVRRPVGPHSDAVDALLRHFEAVGFEGAPKALGRDARGRQVLSFVEGEPGLSPVPSGDHVLSELGTLLRRMHDAQAGFVAPPDAEWHSGPLAPPGGGDVICHNDLFPPNVIFRDGAPVALIDWDLCVPASHLYDIASAANFWAPLAHDARAHAFGLPTEGRAGRLRLLCDGYGLGAAERIDLLDVVAHRNRMGYEIHRLYGGEQQLPGWREMWDAGSGDVILERNAWFEAHRSDLRRSLA
jgi:hypothetical protein